MGERECGIHKYFTIMEIVDTCLSQGKKFVQVIFFCNEALNLVYLPTIIDGFY